MGVFIFDAEKSEDGTLKRLLALLFVGLGRRKNNFANILDLDRCIFFSQ